MKTNPNPNSNAICYQTAFSSKQYTDIIKCGNSLEAYYLQSTPYAICYHTSPSLLLLQVWQTQQGSYPLMLCVELTCAHFTCPKHWRVKGREPPFHLGQVINEGTDQRRWEIEKEENGHVSFTNISSWSVSVVIYHLLWWLTCSSTLVGVASYWRSDGSLKPYTTHVDGNLMEFLKWENIHWNLRIL